ncbi:MAG: hypothetical protein HHAS10_07290 [Candidatus Altimarinota bacterium]
MKESIVLHAWEVITHFPSLKKLNFFPSFIGMVWLFLILLYQLTFTYITVFHQKDKFIQLISDFIHKDYFTEVLIGLACIFLLYMILVPIAEGGIVEMIHSYRKTNGEKVRRTFQGIFDGLRHFLPLFEAHNVVAIFRPLSIITFYILLLRIFGTKYLVPISYLMGGYLIFAFFLNMCFAYTKYFIIFEHKSVVPALAASTSMAVRHIGITMQLYYTMVLLYLRTILVAIFFLVIPFFLSGIVAFFTIQSVVITLITLSLLVCVILFIFIAHLNSTLEIFVEATWYEAYQLCKKEDAEDGHHEESHGHGNTHDVHGHTEHHDTHHDAHHH